LREVEASFQTEGLDLAQIRERVFDKIANIKLRFRKKNARKIRPAGAIDGGKSRRPKRD
jgi:hypothetical protein